MVTQVSQAHAQVMMQGVGDADGEAKTEQSLSKPESVEVAVTAEERAGDRSPDERRSGERKIGQVRYSEPVY